MLNSLWPKLKTWRKLNLGPVQFVFSFRRRALQSGGILVRRLPSAPVFSPEPGQPLALAQTGATKPTDRRTVGTGVIVGAGPGLGHALARRLAQEGFDLVLVTRDAAKNSELVRELLTYGGNISTMGSDATDETSVLHLFSKIEALFGVPTLVVYSLQEFGPGRTTDISVPAFESAWRQNCLGAFLVGRSAARAMSKVGSGTLVFIGSTSSIIGREGHLNLAVGKFGQRAISQVLARELWPLGVHVSHIMIDADIQEDEADFQSQPHAYPADIAETILTIHNQPRTAWTSELDMRPWNESFWNHC